MTTAAAPHRAKKKSSTRTLTTELGLAIKVLPSHRIAEEVAKFREEIEDRQTRVEKRLPDLLKQMKADAIAELSAKGPGGTLYKFEHVCPEEKVKVTKPTT